MDTFFIIAVVLFIIVPFVGVVASRLREIGQQQQQRPMAPGDNRRIQEQIDEFLRRASQGGPRAGTPAQPPATRTQGVPRVPQPPPARGGTAQAPTPVEVLDDDQVGSGVGQQTQQYLDTSAFRRRSEAMGGEVVQADEQFTQQVRKTFSGEVGKLASRRGDTAAPPEVVEPEVVEAEVVTDAEAARPTLEAPPVAGSGLADLLGSSDNIVHAVIMSEILNRREW